MEFLLLVIFVKKRGQINLKVHLFKLKQKKIIHDKKEQTVRFYDSYLDVKGKSIFYLPYFSVASPLVKRKAGFIAPSYKQNYYFGFSADIPYYIPISDYQDLTIQPKFSQKKNPAVYIEHRKNFRNGEIVTDFSGTIENQEVNITKTDKKRGHLRSHSKFDINENTYLDLKLQCYELQQMVTNTQLSLILYPV